MKFKKTLLVVCLLVCLFSIAGVCASDNSTDDFVQTDDCGHDAIASGTADENAVISGDGGNINTTLTSDDVETGGNEAFTIGESESPALAGEDDFASVQNMIDSAKEGDTIYLEGKTFKGNGQTIVVNKSITIIGGFSDGDNVNATFDAQKKSGIMLVSADNVNLKGIRFVNGSVTDSGAYNYCLGGAIRVGYFEYVFAVDCVFVGNYAKDGGGAICGGARTCSGSVVNCVFIGNSADGDGGATLSCDASNCTFINNSAECGGAVYSSPVVNCVFVGNSASKYGGAVYSSDVVDCVFVGNHASMKGGGVYNSYAVNCVFVDNSAYQILSDDMCGRIADSCIFEKPHSCYETAFYNPSLTVFNYTSSYNSGDRLKFNLTADYGTAITNRNLTIEIYKDNVLVGTYHCLSGESLPVDLDVGSYVAVCRADDYGIDPVNATLTITKIPTKIAANPITVTYNSNKYLTITLKDSKGNPLSGFALSVNFGNVKNLNTDKKGQVKISTKKFAPKTYNVKISFAGSKYYLKSSASVKVTVKKLKSKITAEKKTFKKSKKVKIYVIYLKSGKNAIKKANVKLTVKGKTFSAKTTSKGKATFKITNLKKNGSFKATVKYAGDTYFSGASKKVTITVKK